MPKAYKVLLSAYACEPNKGSEPGVGWHWALEIAKRGHRVWVLTRKNNNEIIESYFKDNLKPANLEFLYYDLPNWILKNKKWFGVHLYYYLWQLGILSVAKKYHQKIGFDFAHHITFVTIHQPSFLYKIKDIPFFYGPSGGGDTVPKRFLKSFPVKKRLKEILLSIQNKFLVFDPIRYKMFQKANLVFCNSVQTQSFLPKNVLSKSVLSLAIGIESLEVKELNLKKKQNLKILYAGNLLHWKGLHLGLKAFNKVSSRVAAKYTIIGNGNIVEFEKCDYLNPHIDFINKIPQDQLFKLYQSYDLFLFPSYRDSGGMVVLEALAQGLPVICLDLGGPGQIVDETCGRVIVTKGKSELEIITSLANVMFELSQNPVILKQLSEGAIKKAAAYTWGKTVSNVYDSIEKYMSKHQLNE